MVYVCAALPLACVGVFLVVGCGSPGTPVASPSASNPPSSPTSTSSAPAIANPLDVSKLYSDPCSAFTAAQIEPWMGSTVAGNSGTQKENESVGCDYGPTDTTQGDVGVTIFPTIGPSLLDNLSTMLSATTGQRVPNIDGYPAAHAWFEINSPQTGDCTTYLAVSDKAVIAVGSHSAAEKTWKYYTNACTPADALVAQLVANIKAGG